jgi:hypothetical protein
LVVVASVALWLLLAGPAKVLGIDTGNAGIVLLLAVAWVSLYAISRMPDGGIGHAVSPGEWRAWLAFGFTAAIAAYAVAHAGVFQGPPLSRNPDAGRVGRNIAMLAIAWMVLSRLLGARWRAKVEADERDRAIESRAASCASTSLGVYVIGLAVMLGFTSAEKLAWAPPPMIAHLLVIGLILSCMIAYGVTAVAYWRDRR